MNQKWIWISALPVIALFAGLQLTLDLGEMGKLDSDFLLEKIYPFAQTANGFWTNLKFKSRGPEPVRNKIVIVAADNASVSADALGRWPWHREVYAYLFDTIFSLGAKSLSVDVSFSEPENRVPEELYEKFKGNKKVLTEFHALEGDRIFSDAVKRNSPHLVLGYGAEVECQPRYEKADDCPVGDPDQIQKIEETIGKFALPDPAPMDAFSLLRSPMTFLIDIFANIPLLRDAAKNAGFFSITPDRDGFVRRYPLIRLSGNTVYPSLGLKAAEISLQDEAKFEFSKDGLVKRAWFAKHPEKPIPVTPLGYLNLNFRGPAYHFAYLNVLQTLKGGENQDPEIRKMFEGADVFFGATAVGIYDMRSFPFDSNTPGVEGHATALDNLLSGDMLKSASASGFGWLPLSVLILFGVLFAVAFSRYPAIPSLGIFLVFMAAFGWIDTKILFANQVNLPTVFLFFEIFSIFALILSIRYVIEERNKKFVRDAFSKYLAPQVVDLVLEDPDKLQVGGERKELTILFSDLRGFTSFSENMDPKTLTQFLNEYLSEMTEIIFQYQGTLDKYIGDAVMAFWGAPLDQPDHAERAWKAALAMNRRLAEIAPDFKTRYGIDVSAGIGVHSGVVSVGNMGSKRIFEYTVIGDHVNLASRLESLTRLYGCDILTTQDTLERIPLHARDGFKVRTLDSVKVKGKKNAVEILALQSEATPDAVTARFEEAKSAFRDREWDRALTLFEEASELNLSLQGARDPVSEVYLRRCEEFKNEPPSQDWDGSIEMRRK